MIAALECRIPPLVYLFVFGLLVLFLSSFCPLHRFRLPLAAPFSCLLAVFGGALAVAAAAQFLRSGTTVSPVHPQQGTALVVSGLFRVSRNPMYLGMLLMLAGWVLALGGLSGVIVLGLFVVTITRFQILPEERVLLRKFGDDFLLYKNNVRRWI